MNGYDERVRLLCGERVKVAIFFQFLHNPAFACLPAGLRFFVVDETYIGCEVLDSQLLVFVNVASTTQVKISTINWQCRNYTPTFASIIQNAFKGFPIQINVNEEVM